MEGIPAKAGRKHESTGSSALGFLRQDIKDMEYLCHKMMRYAQKTTYIASAPVAVAVAQCSSLP